MNGNSGGVDMCLGLHHILNLSDGSKSQTIPLQAMFTAP